MKGRYLEGRKYGILKFGRFWRVGVCIADIDILHPVTVPSLGTTPLNCQCSTTPHKAACTASQETYTADLSEHSPAVKLYKIHIVQLLLRPTDNRNSMFCTIHARVSKFGIKFENICVKFGHLLLRKIFNFILSTSSR